MGRAIRKLDNWHFLWGKLNTADRDTCSRACVSKIMVQIKMDCVNYFVFTHLVSVCIE